MNVYEKLGESLIRAVVAEHCRRAKSDRIIGHLFCGRDLPSIIEEQTTFMINMLGGPKHYEGKPLEVAQDIIPSQPEHRRRHRALLEDVLHHYDIDRAVREEWLILDENLHNLVKTRRQMLETKAPKPSEKVDFGDPDLSVNYRKPVSLWQPIETYEYPTETWDYDYPKTLFYSAEKGIVIGRCIFMDADVDEKEYSFQYDRECWDIEPTHWMPLPETPKEPK